MTGVQAAAAMTDGRAPGIIDAQVHVWLRPDARFPWADGLLEQLPAELRPRYTAADRSADELVGMMDEVGVRTTVLTSPWLYGADHSYAHDAAARFAGRFAVVGPYELPCADPRAELAALDRHPHALGARILLASPGSPSNAVPTGAADAFVAEAAGLGIPVFLSPVGRLAEVGRLARAHPGATLVLDHAGLWVPGPVDRRRDLLPAVLELADLPNVLVKCTALPELSERPFPYPDLWRLLHPLLDRFGPRRMMWGSDINQHRDRLTYAQSLDYLRDSAELSDADRTEVLGGTAARLLAARPGPEGIR